jgi:hypothetical protein
VFDLRGGAHRTVPKPPAPPGYDTPFSVQGEWAGADTYTVTPESLRIGVDVGAGREFVDVGFAAIENGAKELR